MITPKKKWVKVPPKSASKIYRKIAGWLCQKKLKEYVLIEEGGIRISEFICDNFLTLGVSAEDPVREFFTFLFKEGPMYGFGGWWPVYPHDFESRILALLLAAEICERGKF